MELKYDFLDDKAYLGIKIIRKQKEEYFELVFMLIDLMTNIMDSNSFKEYRDVRDKYITATLYDCYTTYSSEILLLERGLVTDFEILLRAFYEKKFKLFSVINKKRNYKKAVSEGLYSKEQLINNIKKNEHKAFNDLVDNVKKDYPEEENNGKAMSTQSWANNAGLIKEYDKEYALLSGRVHFDIDSLSSKIVEKDGETTFYTFSYKEFDDYVFIASHQFYICILKVLEYKGIKDYSDRLDKINKKFEELTKEGDENESSM